MNEAERAWKAELEALKLKLKHAEDTATAKPQSTDGDTDESTKSTTTSSPDDDAKTHSSSAVESASPLKSYFAEEDRELTTRLKAAEKDSKRLRSQIKELKRENSSSASAVAEVTRKQQRQLRMELQAARASLDIAQAELEVFKKSSSKTDDSDGDGNDTEDSDVATSLRKQIVELKRAAAEAENTFLKTVLASKFGSVVDSASSFLSLLFLLLLFLFFVLPCCCRLTN